MERIQRVGIDTSKHIFTVHGVDEEIDRCYGDPKRGTFLQFSARLPPTNVALRRAERPTTEAAYCRAGDELFRSLLVHGATAVAGVLH